MFAAYAGPGKSVSSSDPLSYFGTTKSVRKYQTRKADKKGSAEMEPLGGIFACCHISEPQKPSENTRPARRIKKGVRKWSR